MSSVLQSTGTQSAGAVASISKAYAGDVAAESLLLAIVVTSFREVRPEGLADSRGNVWYRDGYVQRMGGSPDGFDVIGFWSAIAKDSGPCTVTATPQISDTLSIVVIEVAGNWSADRIDVGLTTAPTDAAGTAISTRDMLTSCTAFIIAACTYGDTPSTTITPNTGAGWIEIYEAEGAVSAMPVNVVHQIAPEGTYNPDWTLGASHQNTCGAIAYKERPAL